MNYQQIIGLLCAIASSFGWPLFSLIFKDIFISTKISPFYMVYFRCLIPFILTIPYAIATGADIIMIPKKFSIDFFARVLCWVTGLFLNFTSLKLLSLSKLTIIFFTGPIITSILGYFIINEKLSTYDYIGCISSFLGVLIVATNKKVDTTNPMIASEPWWGFMIPLTWAIINSFGDVFHKKLAGAVRPTTIQIWMYALSMFLAPTISLAVHSEGYNEFNGFTMSFVFKTFLGSIVGIVSLTLYMTALKYEKAGRVAAINYLQVFNAIMIDIFYYNINVGMRNILGAILIVSCSFTITMLKAFEIIK